MNTLKTFDRQSICPYNLPMREWHLSANDLRTITLAADARLCTPNYIDDQSWELVLAGGEPAAFALQTTYGLRARSMRLFPRFVEGDLARSDPAEFTAPPLVRYFFPNFLVVSFQPFPEIDTTIEYWAPESQAVAGRVRVANLGKTPRQIRLEWVALLAPGEVLRAENSQRMAPLTLQAVQVLAGRSGGLEPVLFMTNGVTAVSGPYPALTIDLEIPPAAARQVIWSQAALPTAADSFSLARQIAARNWDAEKARIELLNASQVEIHTGNPDWDLAFALSQKIALGSFLGRTEHLPFPSFVNTRRPDFGYSLRADGGDYGMLWNGQSALDCHILANLMLPAAPDLVQGLLFNFLAVQTENGTIDWKPGLAGQRGNKIVTPLLASLAWRVYQMTEDRKILSELFPKLLDYFFAWFMPEHDRDQDGLPEWDHPLQAGLEDHPTFARWHRWSQGIDISTVESPVLCAFLYHECQALLRMARLLDRPDPTTALQALADGLRTAVESSWDASAATYRYWDRETHLSPLGSCLRELQGSQELAIGQEFDQPTRLIIRIQAVNENTRRPLVFIHGVSVSGAHRVERLGADSFQWFMGYGSATSERAYQSIETIGIQGLDPADQIRLQTTDLTAQDISLLLPLWAGLPSPERTAIIVNESITRPDKYWLPYGLPVCFNLTDEGGFPACHSVQLGWNILIGEGLAASGYFAEAADLVTRLMNAIVENFRSEGSFRRYYHAQTGVGSGERDSIEGLAPVGLFLAAIGIRLISPHRIALVGTNSFPWPITVKYKGMTILRQKEKTQVIFPDGQTISISDPSPQIITLEPLPE